MLAVRLARHGLAVGGGMAGALLDGAAQAAVPGTLAVSTVKAAAAGAAGQAVAMGLLSAHAAVLTEGVIKAMLISKLKTLVTVLLTLGLLTTGAGMMTLTADEPRPGQEVAQARKAADDAPKAEKNKPLTIRFELEPDDGPVFID